MARKTLNTLLIVSAVLLSACSATAEERLENGLEGAREAFEQQPLDTNETAEDLRLYVPGGYTVEETDSANNVLITKDEKQYVLFINPNETADSRLLYSLQKSDPEAVYTVDKTFEKNGRFGFVTVREAAENRYEIVVGSGGVKLTAMSDTNTVGRDIEWMMKTARSVNTER